MCGKVWWFRDIISLAQAFVFLLNIANLSLRRLSKLSTRQHRNEDKIDLVYE
ncbi:MAG: hypothetical protein LBG48_04860 [Rickettsiales bacterium]|nr:hypothetical protein [Rickettsiales bacterium]